MTQSLQSRIEKSITPDAELPPEALLTRDKTVKEVKQVVSDLKTRQDRNEKASYFKQPLTTRL